jgi:hypothetical protein
VRRQVQKQKPTRPTIEHISFLKPDCCDNGPVPGGTATSALVGIACR